MGAQEAVRVDSLVSKLPPQNLEAEKSVLGGIMLDNESLYNVAEVLSPDDFYREAHRKIFKAMIKLSEEGEPIDLVTVANRLKGDGVLDEAGGAAYLSSLVDTLPTAANLVSYARIVREKSVLRNLMQRATEIITRGYGITENIDEYLDQAEKEIFEIAQRRIRQSFFPLKELIKDNFKLIEQLYERRELITGVPTGYHELDRLTAGLQPSDLIVVAGRPSMGKTAFALCVAANAALQKKIPCAIFSLEMSKEQLVQRLLCMEGRIDATKLRGGFLTESDWPRLTRAAGVLSEAPLFIDDTPAITVLEIRAKARRLQKEHGLGLVVVDYLQLIRGIGRLDNREREISEISRSLKALAKELHIPVMALSQLNRMVESRKPPIPILADLRESGAIEQDADVIMFLYREEVYDRETINKGVAEVIIGKQRNGPIGRTELTFLSGFTRFENLSRDHS
ncbi:MAG: replicative DNA helicase [Deltaproteobacteria bacterium]|nr:replicative DNA helicase [Deltaproteobacteria bacterium]MBI4196555.1 replicative DNA helicase [Deltaproteobacteria bacterium]